MSGDLNDSAKLIVPDAIEMLSERNEEQEFIKTINLSGKSLIKVKKNGIIRRQHASNNDGSVETEGSEFDKPFTAKLKRKRKEFENSLSLHDSNGHRKSVNEVERCRNKNKGYRRQPGCKNKSGNNSENKGDPYHFNIKLKGSYACWICYRKFTHCMTVKKHILEKHSEAFCALSESLTSLPQLLLFCPQNCDYVTSDLEAFSNHVSKCQDSCLIEGKDFLVIQHNFISKGYTELMNKVTSETIFDFMEGRKISEAKKRKKECKLRAKAKEKKKKEELRIMSNSTEGLNSSIEQPAQHSRIKIEDVQQEGTELNDIHLCNVCNEAFPTSLALNQHLEHNHLEVEKKYITQITNGSAALSEAEMTTGSDSYRCKWCNKVFSSNQYLISHLRIHKELTEKRNFKCDKCGKTFTRTMNLLIHMRVHTGEKPFKCNECGRSFNTNSNILTHMRIHTGEKPFKCEECGKSFCRKNDLRTHMRIHTGEKPFKCEECGQSFRTNSNILNHMRVHTGEKPYICHECGNSFGRSGDLMVHKRIHTGERPFKCSECGQSYKTNWNLLLHMRRHTGEKPYKCSECARCFARSGELNNHMRMHTGEKPFQCGECGKAFGRNAELQLHMESHTGIADLRFRCDFCDKGFRRGVDLSNHMRAHTGERPFQCKECGKSFSRNFALKKHMILHS